MYRWQRVQFFNRIFVPVALLLLLMLSGVAGYMIIEHYNLLEAIYMTVITVASVGYEEVRPLSEAGMIFTTILILFNIGLFTLFLTLLTRYFVDGEFMRQYKLIKMQNKIDKLSGHVIVCGFGRNGREAAQVLHDNGIPFVVLESKDVPKDLPFELEHFQIGDATRDDTLLQAGIHRSGQTHGACAHDHQRMTLARLRGEVCRRLVGELGIRVLAHIGVVSRRFDVMNRSLTLVNEFL